MNELDVSVGIPELHQRQIIKHLLNSEGCEEAAFAFCSFMQTAQEARFDLIEWYAVPPTGFITRSPYFLELADEIRGRVIKRAHDLDASLVEFHSHRSHWPAAFSLSDFAGFDEFVPHVWWRLKGRPYAAVVVAESSFDGIAWIHDETIPVPLTVIDVGGELLLPTGRFSRGSVHNEN